MQNNHDIFYEIVTGFLKSWFWIAGVLSAVVAKIAFGILGGRKLTKLQMAAVAAVSLFGGHMMYIWCHSNGWEKQGGWLVPLTTLFAENIMTWVAQNFNELMKFVFFKKGGKDESGNT